MAVCEIVGGPRDGERFTIPGSLPPERIRVMDTVGGPVVMWHVAARGHHKYSGAAVIEVTLDDTDPGPMRADSPWRYLWPRNGGPPRGTDKGGPPLL